MSIIDLVITGMPGERKAAVFAVLRATTGKGMAEISHAIRACEPVSTETLYGNDHDEAAERLRLLVRSLMSVGVRLRVFGARSDSGESNVRDDIGIDGLLNLLDAWDERGRRQQEMWDEHGHV